MPSRPSLARTVRKEAGTETRPLVSILLVNVETNWSISPSWAPGPTQDFDTLRVRDALLGEWGGEGGAVPPVASKKGPLPSLPHPSPNGRVWDNMGYYGWSRNLMGK